MAQYHFLVVYDTETGEWVRDDETLAVMVAGGPIYDTDIEDWREPASKEEEDFDRILSENLDERLA